MRRTVLALSVCALFVAGSAAAETQIYYGFNIGITNAPPPPTIVYKAAPEVVVVPDSKVYVVARGDNDCDMFRFGSYFYVTSGGFWYRASSYKGPFKVIDVRKVPEPIFVVPGKHWKHHPHGGPPGLAAKVDKGSSAKATKATSKGKGKKGKGR